MSFKFVYTCGMMLIAGAVCAGVTETNKRTPGNGQDTKEGILDEEDARRPAGGYDDADAGRLRR